ncbi:MAG: DJ-1/PfpI family protein [Oscillospiraceae bacterium]|nr:DJ-1/PfpI family protein [Oscillospiraceae bacterium]
MVYVFFADGFEEIEAFAPVDILRRAGVEVQTVGIGNMTPVGSHGISTICDAGVDDMRTDELEGIVLPGGMPGTKNLEESSHVRELVDFCAGSGKLIGAICAAPSILGHMGLLKNRRAACFPDYERELDGADVMREAICRDGNIITSRGAGTALEFGFALVAYLKGEAEAERLRKMMQCV